MGEHGVLSQGGQTPGMLIDCTSINEESSKKVRDYAKGVGTEMIDAPVSGNHHVVVAGKLSIVASGDAASFEKARPFLEAIGRGVSYVGEGELARMVKICHNVMLGVVAQNMAEITVLAEKGGVPRQAFLDFINNSVMGSMFTTYKTPAFVNLDMTPTFTSTTPQRYGSRPFGGPGIRRAYAGHCCGAGMRSVYYRSGLP